MRLLHESFPFAEFHSHTHTVRSRPLPSSAAASAEMNAWKQWRVEFDEMYIKLCVALQLLAKQQAPLQPLHTIKSFKSGHLCCHSRSRCLPLINNKIIILHENNTI